MDAISTAIKKLMSGDVVAFPTETVYGLGADCTNDDAVQKIFAVKGRPSFNPLIIHVHSLSEAEKFGEFNPTALKLAQRFWPGPLTLVVPLIKPCLISNHVTAGLSTIAIRCPNHPVALKLLQNYPNPIAAPSANKSGYVSPTKYSHVYDEFAGDVFIIPGDQSCIGLESTIVDCSESAVFILRPGSITKQQIEETLGIAVSETTSLEKIKAPGQLKNHYSPHLPIRLNALSVLPAEGLLNFGKNSLTADIELNLSPSGDLHEAATNVFDYLRRLDNTDGIHGIAVAPIPNEGVGIAINERLQRAAAPKEHSTRT
jgi:L-threonylcarbamoyladenylate synthase